MANARGARKRLGSEATTEARGPKGAIGDGDALNRVRAPSLRSRALGGFTTVASVASVASPPSGTSYNDFLTMVADIKSMALRLHFSLTFDSPLAHNTFDSADACVVQIAALERQVAGLLPLRAAVGELQSSVARLASTEADLQAQVSRHCAHTSHLLSQVQVRCLRQGRQHIDAYCQGIYALC